MEQQSNNILLVDDAPDIITLWEKALLDKGYEVATAASGEEALKQLEQQPFDAALVDLVLPGIQGMEVVAAIQEIDPTTVVIIVTGYASLDSAIEAVRHDAFDYLRKPVDTSHLINTLSRGLEGRELFRKNRQLLAELDQTNRQMRMSQKTLQERANKLQQHMDGLVKLSSRLVHVQHSQAIMQQLLETAVSLTKVQAGAILQTDTNIGQLQVIVCQGIAPGEIPGSQLQLGQGVLGEVAESGKRQIVRDLLATPQMAEDILVYAGMRRVLAQPLVAADQVVGVIALFDDLDQPFAAEHQDLLAVLAVQAAMVLAETGAVRPAPGSARADQPESPEFTDLESLLKD